MAAACPISLVSPYAAQTAALTAASGNAWLALVVRSRHEKSVKTILDSKGYRTALPLVRCIHKMSTGSAWDSQKPLIAGYVFAALDPDNPFRMVTTPGVVHIVSFGSEPAAIPEAEIDALVRIAASGLPVSNCGYTRIGETVELVDGPLQGLQGIVLRQAKTTRLVVGVELLQRSVMVEIDAAWALPTDRWHRL
jgi:transcription antitermination factor NusG